jgi:hypothetical protein
MGAAKTPSIRLDNRCHDIYPDVVAWTPIDSVRKLPIATPKVEHLLERMACKKAIQKRNIALRVYLRGSLARPLAPDVIRVNRFELGFHERRSSRIELQCFGVLDSRQDPQRDVITNQDNIF